MGNYALDKVGQGVGNADPFYRNFLCDNKQMRKKV